MHDVQLCRRTKAIPRWRERRALETPSTRPLSNVRLPVLMIDGVRLEDHSCVVAVGITTDGVKLPRGLWEGSTENKKVISQLLPNLAHRSLDVEQSVLVVIDGSKALRAPANDVLGLAPRCTAARSTGNVMKTMASGSGSSLQGVPV